MITIKNWATYQAEEGEGRASVRASDKRAEEGTVADKLAALRQKYPGFDIILKQEWLDVGATFPRAVKNGSKAGFEILDTLRKMHEIDKLPIDEIGKIVRYAATQWFPRGYIASPRSLRDKTRSGDKARPSDEMKWEAIQRQMKFNSKDSTPTETIENFDGLRVGTVHQ